MTNVYCKEVGYFKVAAGQFHNSVFLTLQAICMYFAKLHSKYGNLVNMQFIVQPLCKVQSVHTCSSLITLSTHLYQSYLCIISALDYFHPKKYNIYNFLSFNYLLWGR